MSRTEVFILSLSILIPMSAGVVRYRHLPASYHPLLYLLLIGVLNEVICYSFFYYSSNAVPTNIYFLFEFLLFMWLFSNWNSKLKNSKLHKALIIFMVLIWVVENIVFQKIVVFNPLFQVAYSFILILMAVNQLNWLIVNERGNIVAHPVFIICIAMIIYFSYKVLTEVFYHYAPVSLMKNNIFVIEACMNVAYNIILAIAILCIPTKRDFIRPLP